MEMNLLAVPTGVIIGSVFWGGEITKFLLASLSLTYSSKYIFILSPLKLTDSITGIALIKTGGMVSFEPPVGVPLLAQSKNTLTISKSSKTLIREFLILILLKIQNNNYFIKITHLNKQAFNISYIILCKPYRQY
jgi:hypothetical protein